MNELSLLVTNMALLAAVFLSIAYVPAFGKVARR
jgi:hypothetical protein